MSEEETTPSGPSIAAAVAAMMLPYPFTLGATWLAVSAISAAHKSAKRSERRGERLVSMVDADVHEAVRRIAFEEKASVSHVVNTILRAALLPTTVETPSSVDEGDATRLKAAAAGPELATQSAMSSGVPR